MARFLRLHEQLAINIDSIAMVKVEGLEDRAELVVMTNVESPPRRHIVKYCKSFAEAEKELAKLLDHLEELSHERLAIRR